MLLTIHDAQLRKVAFVDNEKQGTLDFFDDTWTRNLQTGSSTYEFSISKKSLVSDTVFNRTYSYLNERAFVSFEYKGETFLFNVMTVEEDEKKIKCYCENLNLELINEYSNPFKADRAMSFVEYCNAMDLLNMTKLSIGINEISDYKRTLEWEGQDTKLARLISLANKFDAEIDFKTYLNDDSTIKQFLVNVYHENDGINYHGVGRDRKDITLVYGKNLKSIKRKVDKTNIFNMIVPTAQSEENSDQKLTIGSLPNWELKNDKGIVEFYKRGDAIYAPISAQLYPSTFTSETQSDQWTRRDMDFNVKSIQQLETEGLKQLKASAYPELTYEFDGYIDADIGDTVELSDGGFANTLLIEARIFEQKLSFSTKKNWKTTLGNFRALQSKLSNDIQSELERLVEDAKPYNIRISTDNGTMFKNNEGESLVKATLWKGGKVVSRDVSWRWALDGNVSVGMQYLARAENINDTAVLTVAAYVGNNEVATTEITLTNVNDGKSSYTHTAYAYSADGTDRFSSVYPNLNLLDGTKDFSGTWDRADGWTNDGTYKGLTVKKRTFQWNGINKIFTAPKDGTYTFSAYIKSSGNAADIMRFSSIGEATKYIGNNFDWIRDSVTLNLKANDIAWIRYEIPNANTDSILWTAGHKWEEGSVATPWMPSESEVTTADWPSYIGHYTDHTQEGSTDPTKYEWFLTKGIDGKDGQTPYIHWAYSDKADGTTGLTSSDNGQRYIGHYSDYMQEDSTDKTKYRWADRWAKIDVGGRNLAQGTSKDWSKPFTGFSGIENTCPNLYKILIDDLSVGDTLKSRIVLKYTDIVPASGRTATIWLQGYGDVTDWNAGAYDGSPFKSISGSGEIVFEHEFKISADHLKNNYWNWQFRTDYIASGSLQWKLAKVEKGTVFSDWSPALEDTQEQIDSKADSALTQEQLNALAEKNNLIKAEMEAKATIDTVNQWITAYQNYVNANNADKAKSEQALKDASERILAIRYEVDNLKVVWDAIDTYMSFQNEGLVIGKKDGSAYAKFSDDRISLFSGSSEVMYISQGTLNIANGIFTKTIQIGRFRFETHPADADMLVVRFVGG
ncbi:hypothetical protein Si110_00227 [Streptococcus infantarius subsp. infantarius]|nr:hypothetical protein [Streptococcus infantarius subsp. infantarius]MCO4513043.1 hypothetical protein [Streptococcus infantarius subsp. infantarius]MCO4514981.1 hypothetical protein [Streptococcus infantarius subsp. infantarius]